MAYSFSSHPKGSEIIRAPGYWYLNPTDLTKESGYGTRLGYTQSGMNIAWNQKIRIYNGVIRGEEPIKAIYCGCNAVASSELNSYNNTVLNFVMPGRYSSSAVRLPGSLDPGTVVSSDIYTNTLLFASDDVSYKPICIIRKALVNVKKTTSFSNQKILSWKLDIIGLSGSGTLAKILYLGDIDHASL